MNIKIVGDNGQVNESQPSPVVEASNEPFKGGELMLQQIATLFDFKPSEIAENKDKLNTLLDYAKMKTEDHTPEGLKWALRNLSIKLGTPPMGEKLIVYLTRFAHLESESMRINAEKEKFLGGGKDDN